MLRGAERVYCAGLSEFGRRGTRRSQTARAWPRVAQQITFYYLNEGIRLKQHRKLEGKICNATVSKRANKYYVSIVVEREIEHLPIVNKQVGIDVGIKDFCILSNGTRYENIKTLKKFKED